MSQKMAGDKSGRAGKVRQLVLGVAIASATAAGGSPALAAVKHHAHHYGAHLSTHTASYTFAHEAAHAGHLRHALAVTGEHKLSYRMQTGVYRHHHYRYTAARYRHSTLQCVPYAREVSHIELTGNAFLWWAEAGGRYARGNVPVEGAVMNFRAIGRMPLGHVAVVTSVIDNRTILVTQANWIRGTITNDVTIEDVSDKNDWSLVEVELGDSSKWGAPYPVYGFIYNQPATQTIYAGAQGNEVAEAPRAQPISTDAPDRDLQ
jgi:surface antigen